MKVRRYVAAVLATAAAVPLLTAVVHVLPSARAAAQPTALASNGRSIVHLFQWRWSSVASECETTLGPHGWGGVQVSPPQEHVVIPSADGAAYPWWQDYQPVSYVLERTRRGTRAEFVDMVARCRAKGVKIYVDVVLNHMTGPGSGTGSAGTPWSKYHYPDLFRDGSGDSYQQADFEPCFRTITNWGNKAEVQDCELLQLADLDTADPQVRRKIAKYMNAVIDLGVAGFRVDAAKHVQEAHLADIIGQLHDVPGFGGRPDLFHEVYGDATVPYTAYAPLGAVTNFDYQRAVSGGFRDGNIAQFGAALNYGGLTGEQAIVFIDNHDTQRATPTLTYHSGDRYYLADAFMMAHPYGRPQLMSSYGFGSVTAQGPPSTADGTTRPTNCGTEWICEHRNEQVAGMVSFRNATEGTGIGNVTTDGSGRLAFARGSRGYAAFNATGSPWTAAFTTTLPNGTYCNVARGTFVGATCTGGTVTVSSGRFSATIPANRGLALHVNAIVGAPPTTPPPTSSPPQGNTSFAATVPTAAGDSVYVVGSIPALGNWNPPSGLRLTAGGGTWNGSVNVPAGTQFQWKLVRISPSGAVQWEDAIGNRTGAGGGSYSVTFNVAGGGGATAAVTFAVNATTSVGQHIFVAGNTAALGNWNPADAVALSSATYPVWRGTINLSTNQPFEYKYLRKHPDGSVTWESGGNRSFTPTGPVTLNDTWRP